MPQDPAGKTELTLDEFREQARERYGIPKGLWESVRGQESGGDINAVSKTGVRGELQVTKRTARGYGLDRDDPFHQIAAGARNLREGYDRYKNQFSDENERWLAATSYYYYGPGGVKSDGTLSTDSKDGVSNPAEHVTRIAQRWKAFNDSQGAQRPAPASSAPAIPKPERVTPESLGARPPRALTSHERRLAGEETAREKATPAIARMVEDFEALKREGSVDAARSVAAKIKQQYGKWMEVGDGAGGWPYVKSRVPGWNPVQPLAAPITTPSLEDQRAAFSQLPLSTQIYERAADALARGGGQVSKMGRQALGAGLGVAQGLAGGDFRPVDFPAWRAGEEERMRILEERRQAHPSSFASDVGEGIIEAVPAASAAILGTVASGGGLPAAMAIGGGMGAAGANWRDPKRALTQTALGAVAPVVGGKAGAAAGRAVASRLASPIAQAVARSGGELLGGGAGNVLGSGAEQLAFEGRVDPRELAKQGVIGAALNVPGAVGAARRPLPIQPIESRPVAPPQLNAQATTDQAIRLAISRYTQAADQINRSAASPAEKAAQLAQARAAYQAERQAARQPAQAPVEPPEAPPQPATPEVTTPTLPPGVRIVRQGEQIPPREKGQRQIPMDIEQTDGTVETVLVLAPDRIDGRRVNETMLRPMVEQALRPQAQSAAQPVTAARPEVVSSQPPPAQPVAPRRQPQAIQFTQLGPEGLRAARTPGGAIIARPSSLPSRKLLGPGRLEDLPTEQLNAPDTRPLQYPDAPETQEMPAIRQRIAAENALTAEMPQTRPTGDEPARQTAEQAPRRAVRPTAELPRPPRPPAITQEPTNRIAEGEGGELQRYSRPLEGQPVEAPGPRRPRTERLPVPKATDENIDQLRARAEELSKLAYYRRGEFPSDLRDEYNQLNASIRDYDNARAPRELAPPAEAGGREVAMTPEEKAVRRAALQSKTSEFPETLTPGRKVTQEVQVPPALKVSESHASREDARQGHFERFSDEELVNEIRRMEDVRNQAIRGRSRLTPAELEANNFDLKIAVEMQKERGRIQRAQGREPGERIAPRAPGRAPKTAEGRKIQHSQFGEVTAAADQSGVRKGQLRVNDVEGKSHVIRNPRIAGNREAAFVKPTTGAIPAEAMPELRAPGAPPSPLQGKPTRAGERINYTIPEEAMPELRGRPKPKFVAEAEQRLKDAASGKLAGSGGQQLVDTAVVAGWKVYEAGIDFARWSAEVVKQAGEKVRPHLRAAWDQIQADYRQMQTEVATRKAVASSATQIASRMARIARTPTSPVELSKLRAEFPQMSKAEFDAAMERLNKEGRIALQRHDRPASMSAAERAGAVKIGNDYFTAATFRERPGQVMGMGPGALQGMSGRKGAPKTAAPAQPGDLTARERLGRKIGTAQTMAQLLNPKTIGANAIGNAAFAGAKNLANAVAVPVDKFLSAFSKQRQVSAPKVSQQISDFKNGFIDAYHAVRAKDYASLADNRYELNNGPVFKGKVGGFFEDVLNIALRAPDKGAYLAAYNDSVQQILAAHAKSKTKFSLDRIHEQAKMEAQQATFQDSNIISKFAVKLRDALNIVTPFGEKANFGLGDMVGLKYARTPANLVARGVEYSPLGFAKAFYKAARVMAGKGKGFDQREAALAFGKAFVGSAFGPGLGAALYSMGVITQPEQENRGVQAAERAEGLTGYQLNLSALKRYATGGLLGVFTGDLSAGKKQAGDVLMSYDWMQPWAFSLGMGAAAAKAFKNRKADADALEDTLTQIDAVTSTLTDQSILRNIKDAFKFGPKSTGRKIITDAPASFVPSVLNQARQIIDDRAREVSKEKGAGGIRREALDKVLNRLPGASKRLPERKDVVGRPVPSRLEGAGGAALVPVPGRFSKYNPHPVLSEMQDVGSGTTGIERRPDETEGRFRARRAVAAEWLNTYGLELTTSDAYRSAAPEVKKEAVKYLKEQISKQSGKKHPSLWLFAPGHILEAARETERENRRKAAEAATSALQ